MLAALLALLTSMAALAGGGSSSSTTSTAGDGGTGFSSKDDDDDEIDDFIGGKDKDDDKDTGGDTGGGDTGGDTGGGDTGSGGGSTGGDTGGDDTGSGGGSTGGDTGGGTTGGGDTGGDDTGSGGGSTGGGTGGGTGSGDDTPDEPVNPNPTNPGQDGGSSDGGDGGSTSTSSGSYSVDGGRVTTLTVENQEDVASIRVIDGPSHGNLTVNPDNTMALVMSMDNDFSGNMSASYEVTYNDGSSTVVTDNINVTQSAQGDGWGEGNHYMLETDDSGDVIVETGENHREVYITGSNNALSLQDIANMEGLSTDQITGNWLVDNPQYGGSEGMALDSEAGMQLWYHLVGPYASGTTPEPSSDWLLFERGYEYDEFGDPWGDYLNINNIQGESALNPIHITSYGEGAKPVLNTQILAGYNNGAENVVISDLEVTHGATIFHSTNIIMDDVDLTNTQVTTANLLGLEAQFSNGLTLHNSSITDVYRIEHPTGSDYWDGYFSSGAYISSVDGLLIEGTLFDHNGWAPDYRMDSSTDGGQVPALFHHNLYLQADTTDVTLRDNFIVRGASYGVHVRGGGYVEDNLFIDNNVGVDLLGGDYGNLGATGNYTLFTDNVVTSAGYKELDTFNGAINWGIRENNGEQTTLLDNIVAHLSDPNNPDEQAEKIYGGSAVYHTKDPYYDDTIIHNWLGSVGYGETGVNTDGLDVNVLNATTIQAFTQQLLGDPNAGIADLANVLRAQAAGTLDEYVDADLVVAYFQTGFGLAVDGRLTPETLRFVPNELGDGIRWDNRLNWNTEDLPGQIAGDSVDLAGNWVNYGGTTEIEDLDFGDGGTLTVTSGRLTINDHTATGDAGAMLNISNAGQVWMDGYTDQDLLEIDVDGGRFVNTGLFTGTTDLEITDGQVVLADGGADFVLNADSRIEITGDDASVGFDGTGGDTSVLLLAEGSDLVYTAESGEGLSTIEEFRTGANDTTDVQSGVNLGNANLELNLSGLDNGEHTLIEVDELIGEFGDVNVTGLGGRGATVTIDYEADRVLLSLSNSGGGLQINTVGEADNAQANADLWAALTNGHGVYAGDNPNDIPSEEDDLDEAA